MPTNEQRREAAKRKLDRQLARRAQRTKRRRRYAVIGSAAAVVLVAGVVVVITFFSGGEQRQAEPADDAPVPALEPSSSAMPVPSQALAPPIRPQPLPVSVDCQYQPNPQPPAKPVTPPPPGPTPAEGTQQATLQTSAGPIGLTLDRALAPCTVKSFTSLAQQGFYNDSPCHRLVTNPGLQVLQCGDPTGQGTGGPGYTIPDEVFPELIYGRGYVAMANTGQPDSGGSQFFLIYGDAQLPPNYTVFATISEEGLKTIDEVAREGDDGSLEPSPGGGKPNKEIIIKSIDLPT